MGQAANPQALAEATKNLATIQYSFREVAKKVLPVVVEVDVTEQAGRPADGEPVRLVLQPAARATGAGSRGSSRAWGPASS